MTAIKMCRRLVLALAIFDRTCAFLPPALKATSSVVLYNAPSYYLEPWGSSNRGPRQNSLVPKNNISNNNVWHYDNSVKGFRSFNLQQLQEYRDRSTGNRSFQLSSQSSNAETPDLELGPIYETIKYTLPWHEKPQAGTSYSYFDSNSDNEKDNVILKSERQEHFDPHTPQWGYDSGGRGWSSHTHDRYNQEDASRTPRQNVYEKRQAQERQVQEKYQLYNPQMAQERWETIRRGGANAKRQLQEQQQQDQYELYRPQMAQERREANRRDWSSHRNDRYDQQVSHAPRQGVYTKRQLEEQQQQEQYQLYRPQMAQERWETPRREIDPVPQDWWERTSPDRMNSALYDNVEQERMVPVQQKYDPITRGPFSSETYQQKFDPITQSPFSNDIHGGNSLKSRYNTNVQETEREAYMQSQNEFSPLDSDFELWKGPNKTPHRVKITSDDGGIRPFKADDAQNKGKTESPVNERKEPVMVIYGGSFRTIPLEQNVTSAVVHLETKGMPLMASVELLHGSEDAKQIALVENESGSPFNAVLDTPGGNATAVCIKNVGWREFPLYVSVQPYECK